MDPAPTLHISHPAQIIKSPAREAYDLCSFHLWAIFTFSAIINIAYLAPTIYMLQVYDRVLASNSINTLIFLSFALAIALLVQTVVDQLRQRILLSASIRLDRVFSMRLFRKLMASTTDAGQPRMGKAMRDLDAIRGAVTGPGMLAILDAPWSLIYVLAAFSIHWVLGLAVLAAATLLLLLAAFNQRLSRSYFAKASIASAASSAAQEAIYGSTDVIRAMGMSEAFAHHFEQKRVQANLPQLAAQSVIGRVGGAIRFTRLLLQSIALGLGAALAIGKMISPGEIFACSMLLGRALGPIDQAVSQWRSLQTGATAYRDLKPLLTATPQPSRTSLPNPRARIQLSQVTVKEPGRERPLLDKIDLEISGGAILTVLGPSGAGKSTLLKVMAGARPATEGQISLDGANYRDWDPERLGRLIGYLPQDSILFPGTIKENICRFETYLGGDAIDEKAIAAAKAAKVHELILSLPQGYDTVIGMRGFGLSAGQQQRIAMARALYGDPSVFILDEPNANLDAAGESELLEVLTELRRLGRLVIVAAHRSPIVSISDMLAIIVDGKLDRMGRTQDIISRTSRTGPIVSPDNALSPSAP
jgi:PrtD family type I secretion system ABC transporter